MEEIKKLEDEIKKLDYKVFEMTQHLYELKENKLKELGYTIGTQVEYTNRCYVTKVYEIVHFAGGRAVLKPLKKDGTPSLIGYEDIELSDDIKEHYRIIKKGK